MSGGLKEGRETWKGGEERGRSMTRRVRGGV